MEFPVAIRLLTSGVEQNVVLSKQLVQVESIELREVLAVGWNGGVSSGAYIRLHHPQLNEIGIHDRPQAGCMLLIDVLNPFQQYDRKVIARGGIGNLNNFRISVSNLGGAPTTFTELYLVLAVRCTPQMTSASARLANAMEDVPQVKGADPRQMKFLG